MPNASASRETERIELKSCPGAFVELRTMTFGEWQKRQDIAMQIGMDMANRKQGPRGLTFDVSNQRVTQFEFERCVVDHNLEDVSGRKYNFSNANDLADLDPRVGSEISDLIAKRHEWSEEDQGNFTDSSKS